MIEKQKKIAFWVFIAITLIVSLSNIYSNYASADNIEDYIINTESSYTFEKSPLELDVVKWNNEINENFYYNISRVGQWHSIESIKANGGVCSHYAYWYRKLANDAGYHASSYVMFIEEPIGHEIAIVWDRDLSTYCVLDQDSIVGCMRLG